MMTKEDKELLLKDLCSRLPYKVKVQIPDKHGGYTAVIESIDIDEYITDSEGECLEVEKVKPYLFPLSSMTEEQGKELEKIDPEFYSLISENGNIYISMDIRGYDWLLKNNFDFRGLIPMGLALDATGLNIY